MKKILFVTNDFGPRAGGIESFVMGLVERLPRDSVTVFTSSQGDTSHYDSNWSQDHGVEIVRDRSTMLLPIPRVARNLKKLAHEGGFAVACFGAAAPLGLLAPTLRKAGITRIISLTHGHEVWWVKVFPFSLAMRRIGNTVDALTYLGDFTRRSISWGLSTAAREAMVRIAPGIDISHFAPDSAPSKLRKKLGLSEKSLIVSVGRLVPRKGQDRLIEALPIIRKAIPNVHLLLVGEGSYRKTLEKLAEEQGVAELVTFVGRIPYAQLPDYYRCGDIFAMPSRSRMAGLEVEGLGIVYLEASGCGLPVIAGNSGGAPDAVVDGVTGIVVDGGNVNEIAAAIVRVLTDPKKMRAMGAAGTDWVTTGWSWQIWSEKFARLLGV
jgi:phosphatidylinositol alpha-1,6-mannosyltransferase